MQHECLYTGAAFEPKRRNQVFISSKARRDYHNANAAAIRKSKGPIDKVLEKNYLILSKRVKKGENKTFFRDDLLMSGFNTNYITHFDTFNGKIAACLYHFVIPKGDNPNIIQVFYP
jgi:hypothetical protein